MINVSPPQLFKGKFYRCEGPDTKNVTNKTDCLQLPAGTYHWKRKKYNFDNLVQVRINGLRLGAGGGQTICVRANAISVK